jgi:hypothetical protein
VGLVALSGFLPRLKGYGRTFQLGHWLTTFPKAVRTEWRDRADGPCLAVFDRGDMRALDGSGAVSSESRDHRATLHGWRKGRRWTEVDARYFFGYAFASYAAVPFILPTLRYLGPTRALVDRQRLRGVRVQYPAGAQVHCRRQAYFFDDSGLVRRNDYVADLVGPVAAGAHRWDDFVTVEGLPLPARRTVLFRLGRRAVPFLVALRATFTGLAVRLSPP